VASANTGDLKRLPENLL
jgi:hypothetical protein